MTRTIIGLLAILPLTQIHAAGVTPDNTFVIDSSQSTVAVTITGGGANPTMDSSPMSGDFTLVLGNPVAGTPNTWNSNVELETILASADNPLSIGTGFVQIDIDVLAFSDFDQNNADSTLLAGGPPISSGSLSTEIFYETQGTATVFGTTGEFDLSDWTDAIDWEISVADDNFLGATTPGNLEASIMGSALIPLLDGGNIFVEVSLELLGSTQYTPAAVPVPAAIWLFGPGLLGLVGTGWRRARQ